jgi:hypothetical protein
MQGKMAFPYFLSLFLYETMDGILLGAVRLGGIFQIILKQTNGEINATSIPGHRLNIVIRDLHNPEMNTVDMKT